MSTQERHRATVGVFGIPLRRKNYRIEGLWSKRADGLGINAVGGRVDPEDSKAKRTFQEVLQREFLEETGCEVEVGKLIGVYPNADLSDVAILFDVRIVSGEPVPTAEAVEHLWMTPEEVVVAAKRYDEGHHENGLVSGVGNRQWKMARDFFLLRFGPGMTEAYRIPGELSAPSKM